MLIAAINSWNRISIGFRSVPRLEAGLAPEFSKGCFRGATRLASIEPALRRLEDAGVNCSEQQNDARKTLALLGSLPHPTRQRKFDSVAIVHVLKSPAVATIGPNQFTDQRTGQAWHIFGGGSVPSRRSSVTRR